MLLQRIFICTLSFSYPRFPPPPPRSPPRSRFDIAFVVLTRGKGTQHLHPSLVTKACVFVVSADPPLGVYVYDVSCGLTCLHNLVYHSYHKIPIRRRWLTVVRRHTTPITATVRPPTPGQGADGDNHAIRSLFPTNDI